MTNMNGSNINIGEITIEEFAPHQFRYNGIHITSIYKYDVTNMRFHTMNLVLIKEQIGEYAYNKLIPYLLLDQV